jgi:hypothetical protein
MIVVFPDAGTVWPPSLAERLSHDSTNEKITVVFEK